VFRIINTLGPDMYAIPNVCHMTACAEISQLFINIFPHRNIHTVTFHHVTEWNLRYGAEKLNAVGSTVP
jgi:hypothetical protein